jgi:hypothetical protein
MLTMAGDKRIDDECVLQSEVVDMMEEIQATVIPGFYAKTKYSSYA